MDVVSELVGDKAVVIFSKSSCCVCHSIKQLISGYGANAMVYEIDEMPNGSEVEQALESALGSEPSVPAVYIGKKLVGGSSDVISLQVQGKLVPMLMEAGAIWVWNTTSTDH